MSKIEPVTITKAAISEIKDILLNKNIPTGYGLRVGVRTAGCGVADQFVGFDTEKDGDIVYEIDGIKVIVEKKQVMFLMGQEIDFYEGNTERGFSFELKK